MTSGKVDLDAPVRTYLPEFTLKDEETARAVKVLQLFNHTAGWSGDVMDDTGAGDDALTRYVERLATVEQVTPLGSAVSYNNAALSVAGLIIERVTGKTFEQAIRELLFEPIGLDHSWFFPNEIMTRRFVVGHNQRPDGTISVARPWAMPRGGNPAGGISSRDPVAGTSRDCSASWARSICSSTTAGTPRETRAGSSARHGRCSWRAARSSQTTSTVTGASSGSVSRTCSPGPSPN